MRLLTDPVLRRRVGRVVEWRNRSGRLDPLDAVLISHLHRDHFDVPSLVPAARRTPGRACRERRAAAEQGFRVVTELSPGRRSVSDRSGSWPSCQSRWTAGAVWTLGGGGRLRRIRALRIYFAGDTDLFDGMARLGQAWTWRCSRSGAGDRPSARDTSIPFARRARSRCCGRASRSPSIGARCSRQSSGGCCQMPSVGHRSSLRAMRSGSRQTSRCGSCSPARPRP